MVVLLLLTTALLSSQSTTDAQPIFRLRDITLFIEPGTEVTWGTNVTLRCHAVVRTSGQVPLSRKYTIYRNNNLIYTKTTSSTEDLLYPLHQVTLTSAGNYECAVAIDQQVVSSQVKKLTVTGVPELPPPLLVLTKGVVTEGEEITARCMTPGERAVYFYFYMDSRKISEKRVNSNQSEARFHLKDVGIHKIHCSYIVQIDLDAYKSGNSNTVTVSVKELHITPVLEIAPQQKIYEGDQLTITCSVNRSQYNTEPIPLLLNRGTKILSRGVNKVNHSIVALASDPAMFECELELGKMVKVTSKTISVTELFSVPTLRMFPAEVFQKDDITLTCRSESFASERINKSELTYTLNPPQPFMSYRGNGAFYGKALQYEFNYSCVAQAKGIVKHSEVLTVRPKVSVSIPKILVVGSAVLGKPIKILCQSDAGSLPINYTLLKGYDPVSTATVRLPSQKAVFTVNITRADELNRYMCEAKNSRKEPPLSARLNASAIVPLSYATLTVLPNLAEISEGHHLYLICTTTGTPPVTFKWYNLDLKLLLYTVTSNSNNTDYQIPVLSKKHSGTYQCEAVNRANNVVYSDPVVIEVHMALWKKILIGAFCALAVVVGAVLVFAFYFRSRRGKREPPHELSVKPSSPKSDDSLTVALTHDTAAYNTATVRVDRAEVSVWTKKPPESDTVNDEDSSVVTNERDVEYTEVVHPQPVEPSRVPLRKGTDTVYSELQNSPHGMDDHYGYGSVEYAELNSEQTELCHFQPEVNSDQDLPLPVD